MSGTLEFNKIAGAVLGAMTIAIGLNVGASILFKPEKPKVPGYELPGEVAAAPAGAPVVVAEAPIAERLAAADASRGQRAAQACASCHSFNQGGRNGVGPNMWNVVDGPKAHIEGFAYSNALRERKAKGEKWGVEELDQFIRGPRQYIAGTSMSFAGVTNPNTRADIIAYLQSLK